MEIAVPCIICKSNSPCDCKNAVIRYFSILEAVHKRILSLNPSSKTPENLINSGGIDKLNAYFLEQPNFSEVSKKAKQSGWEFKQVRLKNRPYIQLRRQKCVLLLSFNHEFITGFLSNPNNFENWGSYLACIESLFPSQSIQTAKISRLDLNLDFSQPFETLIGKIDIKNKSIQTRYDDKGGRRTGMYIGKEPSTIVIYDKSKKEKLPSPLTRIELRLSGYKLPSRSIKEVTKELQRKTFFAELVGCELNFKENNLNENQKSKTQEFKSIMKRDGLYAARKTMNQSRNFDRDFNKIIETTQWATPISEAYRGQIKRFIGVE